MKRGLLWIIYWWIFIFYVNCWITFEGKITTWKESNDKSYIMIRSRMQWKCCFLITAPLVAGEPLFLVVFCSSHQHLVTHQSTKSTWVFFHPWAPVGWNCFQPEKLPTHQQLPADYRLFRLSLPFIDTCLHSPALWGNKVMECTSSVSPGFYCCICRPVGWIFNYEFRTNAR